MGASHQHEEEEDDDGEGGGASRGAEAEPIVGARRVAQDEVPASDERHFYTWESALLFAVFGDSEGGVVTALAPW